MSLFLMLQVIIHTKRKERTKRKRRYQKLQNPSPVHQERFITFCLWLKLHWSVFSIRHRCTLTTVWWQFNYHNTFNIDYTCEFVTLFSFFFFFNNPAERFHNSRQCLPKVLESFCWWFKHSEWNPGLVK